MFTRRDCNQIAAAIAAGLIGLALAEAAGAVDLRDWGRKFPTAERFVVLSQFGNQAVLDKETQLVWQRSPSSGTGIWQGAINACFQLEVAGRLAWRLPTVPELLSLLRADAPNSGPSLPAGHPFQNVESGLYWAANLPRSSFGQPVTLGYVVGFNSGPLFVTPLSDHRLRWCVRGGGTLSE
ncbi:MAG: DUF1566 domain-containing protein [Steroidobacteraceae bacterium]